MLRSRAITAGLKSIGFDPTAGIYAPGELGGPEPIVVEGEVLPASYSEPEPDPLDESLALMYGQVDADTAMKARQAVAAGHDKRKVLARLTEMAMVNTNGGDK
jgi:hypothetical protein